MKDIEIKKGIAKERQKQVSNQLNRLTSTRENLHERISVLTNVLNPVLRNENKSDKKEGVVKECMVDLAYKISIECDVLDELISHINDILDRIEL